MSNAPDTGPDDEPQPTRLGSLLYVVRVLLDYGRHLADTVAQRAANPNFASIAVYFGTANLPRIVARIERGLLRATALARLLDALLEKGLDVAWIAPGHYSNAPPIDPEPASPKHPRRSAAACRASSDELAYPLTLEEIEAQVRRRPIGRTIVDICLDLAVVPELCGPVWDELYQAIYWYRGSLKRLMTEKCKRYKAFQLERDCGPTNGWWEWWDNTKERIRGVLGFSIGEPPVLPRLSPPPLAGGG